MKITKKTIIHVDDDNLYLDFVHYIFSPFNFVVRSCSGKRLLEYLECINADLIILDVEMPEMDGWETIMHLKKNDATKNIPVIFFSGSDSREEIEKGLSLGAVDYITKPCIPDELIERVHSLLYA